MQEAASPEIGGAGVNFLLPKPIGSKSTCSAMVFMKEKVASSTTPVEGSPSLERNGSIRRPVCEKSFLKSNGQGSTRPRLARYLPHPVAECERFLITRC